MSEPYLKTIRLLAKSKNRAASRLLDAALRSSHDGLQAQACQEVFDSRGARSLLELIRHFDTLEPRMIAQMEAHREKLVGALRLAVLSDNESLRRNGYRAILSLMVVEMIPELLPILYSRQTPPSADAPIGETVIALTDHLAARLGASKRRQFYFSVVLNDIVRVVAAQIKFFRREDSPVLLQVFLTLYPYIRDRDAFLKDLFENRTHPAFLALNSLLLQSREAYVVDFLVRVLDENDPPRVALQAVAKRDDSIFLKKLCLKLLENPDKELVANLGKIEQVEWTGQVRLALDQLPADAQGGLVEFFRLCNIEPEQRLTAFLRIFKYGKTPARIRVVSALANLSGEHVQEMLLQAAEDNDPTVRATALTQIKAHDLPGANFLILRHVDSHSDIVRETVRNLLPEFRLKRFVDSFEQFSEPQRRSTVSLIRKLDPHFLEQIREMLLTGTPEQKAKALLCVEYSETTTQVEDILGSILLSESHASLRRKSAELLGRGRRDVSRNSLVQAFHRDADPDVRQAARISLENRPAPWGRQE